VGAHRCAAAPGPFACVGDVTGPAAPETPP
jgi:hypothetical protein